MLKREKIKKFLQKTKPGKALLKKYRSVHRRIMLKKMSKTSDTDEKMVVFSSFNGRLYTCSPKAIYEYMLQSPEFSDFKFVWAFRKPYEHKDFLADKRTKLVKYDSKEFFKYLVKAKYWIFNFKTPDYFIKRSDQVFVQCWHGTPFKKIGCDIELDGNAGSSLKAIHRSYINDARKYNYFISPSSYGTEKFITAFHLNELGKENIIIEKGYPRNDGLFSFSTEDIVHIKNNLGIPLADRRKIILYAPTFRDDKYEKGFGHTYDLGINLLRFKEELSDDYIILLRLHYLVANEVDVRQFVGFVYNVSDYDDVNDLYLISDVLVTDYSSVFFDFANLRKPILFYMYDLDNYKNNLRDFYIDFSELPGPISETERDLIDDLKDIDAATSGYEEKYRSFNQKYNYLDHGSAAEDVVKEFIKQ